MYTLISTNLTLSCLMCVYMCVFFYVLGSFSITRISANSIKSNRMSSMRVMRSTNVQRTVRIADPTESDQSSLWVGHFKTSLNCCFCFWVAAAWLLRSLLLSHLLTHLSRVVCAAAVSSCPLAISSLLFYSLVFLFFPSVMLRCCCQCIITVDWYANMHMNF